MAKRNILFCFPFHVKCSLLFLVSVVEEMCDFVGAVGLLAFRGVHFQKHFFSTAAKLCA